MKIPLMPALLCVSLALFSCASAPAPEETGAAAESLAVAEAAATPASEDGLELPGAEPPHPQKETEAEKPEIPSVVDAAQGPADRAYTRALPEPELSLAELVPPGDGPEGSEASAPGLHLPEPAVLLSLPVPGDGGQEVPPSPSAPAIPERVPPSAREESAPPPAETPSPPAPPRYIAPAEAAAPAESFREPVPVPASPVPELPARTPPALTEEETVFSRIVTAQVGQYVEVPFYGSGWVYLGEQGGRRGMAYDSRRNDAEGQTFVFLAEAAGTYALKFYREDFIRNYILNDFVQVMVEEAPAASASWGPTPERGRVVAEPRWPLSGTSLSQGTPETTAAPAAQGPVSGTPEASAPGAAAAPAAAGPQPSASAPPSAVPALRDSGIEAVAPAAAVASPESGRSFSPIEIPPNSPPDTYITRARQEFDAGRVESALYIMDQFRERFPAGTDEAWWLYGQLLEANSPMRDIRGAIGYYRRLMQEYPQSSRYADARRRIAYLERFYINIR